MDVCHAVFDYSPNLLQTLVITHCADRIALHEYVAFRQQLQCLQSRALWPQYALPSLDEALWKITESVLPQ